MCSEEILARGGRVGKIFVDNSLSAWNPKVVRPDWNRLMERIESGATDGVMVYDLFRFTHKIMEDERLIAAAANGARVWAYGGEYRLTTADGRSAFRDVMVKAAGESDRVSERVINGKRRTARRGRRNGGWRAFAMPGLAPVGPEWEPGDKRETVPDELVAAERVVAAEMIERIVGGESVRSVVAELNVRVRAGEVGCATTHGGEWTSSTLPRALRRPEIAGILDFRSGEIVRKLADIEPVVDEETWRRLCSLFDARRTGRPPSVSNLLTGLMRCGERGAPMRPHPPAQATRALPGRVAASGVPLPQGDRDRSGCVGATGSMGAWPMRWCGRRCWCGWATRRTPGG